MAKRVGVFPFAVFLGAFLLFQVQPLIGKYFMPWFGGSPGVWMTCLMFFQVLLLGGYTYAHLLQRLTLRHQVLVHISLLALTVLAGVVLYFVWGSPILPSIKWRPEHTGRPGWNVFRLLLISIGASYFLLSASSSLLQAWVHRAKPSSSPYVLYIVSNVAALLALLSYPFLIEPVFTLKTQALLWGGGFLIYLILCLLSARQVWPILTVEKEGAATDTAGRPGWKSYLHWITLAACGVLALMAVSNQMAQDVPPVPFLLVLPLVLFLLTYIIGFTDRLRGLQRYYIWLIPLACVTAWYLIFKDLNLAIVGKIFGYGFILFSICLFCHNALYQRKPPSRYLTGFYLSISLGGALGGVFVAVIAPQIFRLYWEYQLCLILAAILAIISIYCDRRNPLYLIRHGLWLAVVVLAFFVSKKTIKENETAVYMGRNFFGSIVVNQDTVSRQIRGKREERFPVFIMYHGRISHGMQVAHPEFRDKPNAYYSESSGAGLALLNHPKRIGGKPMRVGVLGLGGGTLAAYGRSGDLYRFYEINPNVIQLAQHSPWFSYLENSRAHIQIVEGDGRISMEDELKIGSAGYDVLVLDAFSGDQIPMHLLTKEAFDIYLQHLADGGVIAINISNHYLDLLPVLVQAENHFKLHLAYIADHPPESPIIHASDWVLLSRDGGFMGQPAIARADSLKKRPIPTVRLWTDNYASLLGLIRP
ncbi:MAG: fused MFS/spermidine synthase [Kiritimatiellales bacterium]